MTRVWKETKDWTRWFFKIFCQYTLKNTASIMCVLKVLLIFRNIILCKLPPVNLCCMIVLLWSSCYYPFFKIIFFSLLFMSTTDIVRAQNYFVFYISNLIQIEEKTHVPVTVPFLDYAFNENIYNMRVFIWHCLLIFFPSK